MSSLTLTLGAKNRTKGKIDRKKGKERKRNEKKLSPLLAVLT